uniref:Gustatory receptor n=1 Tax=Soboliphyme baturini TaxID=241478 RepID=A0A183J6C8_9BILA
LGYFKFSVTLTHILLLILEFLAKVDFLNFTDNIFATAPSELTPGDVRPPDGVLRRMEMRQNRWMAKVHEQRRKIYTDHTMLN